MMRTVRPFLLLAAALLACRLAAGEAPLPGVVYVPFDEVPRLDPAKQGVFLPYAKFIALWDAANPKDPPPTAPEPPVGAALTSYTLTGAVSGESAALTLEGSITALAKGWSSVALPAELAVTAFAAADRRVVVERGADSLRIHLPEPGAFRFTAEVAVPVARDTTGKRSLALVLPAAGAGRLDLLVPDGDAEIALHPLVAATTVAAKGGTRLMAVLGGARQLAVIWRPPLQAVAGDALLLAATDVLLTVAERSVRYDVGAEITILRRPVDELRLALPPDSQVLAVEGRSLRTWEKVGDNVVLHLHEAVEGSYLAKLRLERLLPAMEPGQTRTLDVPWPGVAGAARTTGSLALIQGEGLAVTVVSSEGLSQIDPAELAVPAAVAAFRYLAPPPPSRLAVTRLQPELRAGIHHLVRLGVDEDLINVVLALDVRKAGLFTVACDIPATWEVVDHAASAPARPGAAPGAVLAIDDLHLGPPMGGRRRLDLALRGRLLGTGELTLRFRAQPSIPRDGKPVARLELGVLRLPDARQVRGTLAIAAPRSWALSTVERNGLSSAEVEAIKREGPLAVLAREVGEDEDQPLAFTFLGGALAGALPGAPAAPALVLSAAPRPRELSLRQEELVTIAEGNLRRHIAWRGEVRYSALPALRIQAPTALDERLVFKGPGLAERNAVARADGITTWELRFQSPVLGAFALSAELADELPALVAGKPAQLAIAPLRALDTTRLQHVAAVAREGTLEVTATAVGLEAVAPADLPPGLQGQGVVAGFQGGAAAALDLVVTRHDLVLLADGAVSVARYAAALGEDGIVRVRGELLLTTRGRPFLELRLPEGGDLLEVTVGGRQGRPSRRADGGVVVPLGDATGLSTQVVALVYEQRVAPGRLGRFGSLHITLPRLGAAGDGTPGTATATARPLPVERVELALYLPDGLAAGAWSGDLRRSESRLGMWDGLLRGLVMERLDRQEPPVMTAGEQGLTVPVPLVGTRHALSRLGDGGSVGLRYVARGVLDGLALALAVAGLLLAWLCRRRAAPLAAQALLAGVALLAITGPWLVPAVGFAAGSVVGLLAVGAAASMRGWRAWRASRVSLPLADDPWLAQAVPTAASVPAATTPEAPAAAPPSAPSAGGAADARGADDKP